jgi:hypothetical protein
MAVTTRILKSLTKKAWTRFLDKFGGQLVSGMADTSADAPSAGYAPKRDVYRKMQEQRIVVAGVEDAPEAETSAATDAADEEESDHGHDHGHGHSHDH